MAPRVVIVGGGFGGLYAARALRSAAVNVTLIDKRNYHLFRPMLYQVATGLLSADEIAGPLRSILSQQTNVEVLLDEVTGINPDQRFVHLQQRELPYDFLILATGIKYNYFGHDEWRQFAPGLESLDDADMIRSKILLAFERAEEMASSGQAGTEEIQRLQTFALVGAGTVGVEMASTLAEMSQMALAHDFRHIDPTSARILLYEAGPRILPTYPEDLSTRAQRHLESLGVQVHTSARVTKVDSEGIVVNGERVLAATVLWGAGVVASPAGTLVERCHGQVREDHRRARSVDTTSSGSVRDWRHCSCHCASTQSIRHEITELDAAARSGPARDPGGQVRRRPHSTSCGRAPRTGALLVLGQGRSRNSGADLCRCRLKIRALCGFPRMAPLGDSTCLFPHRVRKSLVRLAAMGI